MEFHINLFLRAFILLAYVFHYIFTLNIEELKPLNYEVDILQTPLQKGKEQSLSSIRMTSKYGQEYHCMLPQVEEEDISEKETVSEKNTDIKELLKPMQSGSCLLKGKDWWTYEFCPGHYIKQFHIEDGQILGQVITLGLYDYDYDWNNETDQEKFKHVKQRYHSQYYVNGTKCDLTGQPRIAEVRIYCEEDASDYIYRVDEPGTCSYLITIHTSRLCSHPQLKPLPSKKAHNIPCHPLLNEDQYLSYMLKINEEKELAEQKRSQWLNNQQERLQVMKNENLQNIENEETSKLTKNLNNINVEKVLMEKDIADDYQEEIGKEEKVLTPEKRIDGAEGAVETFLVHEYDREIEKLKSFLPPEKFATVKNSIQRYFNMILNEAEEDQNPELSKEAREASFKKLTSTLNMLLKKLDKAEKDAVKASKELRSVVSETAYDDDSDDASIESSNLFKNEIEDESDALVDEGPSKVSKIDHKQSSMLDDDELQVRIRRLDRRSTDAVGKLHEMDLVQRKQFEQDVKEKLEKAGLQTGGRRIEVKIISAGYYDNEEGKDFHLLSDEETNQFKNMIMALLTGQQEAVQEMERHKKLEENYQFTWENDDENED